MSKKNFIGSHVLTSAIGIFTAGITFFPLKNIPAIGEIGASFIGLFLGILTVIISDRIYYQSSLQSLEDHISNTFLKSDLFRGSQRTFQNTNVALDYLMTQIPKASKIWNTRIHSQRNAPQLVDIIERTKIHDQKIAAQVQAGAAFEFICNSEFAQDINFFHREHNKKSKTKGTLDIYELNDCNNPILQLTILEYVNGTREAFVGWIFNRQTNVAGVWVTSDEKATRFFVSIFNAYKLNAKVVEPSIPDI